MTHPRFYELVHVINKCWWGVYLQKYKPKQLLENELSLPCPYIWLHLEVRGYRWADSGCWLWNQNWYMLWGIKEISQYLIMEGEEEKGKQERGMHHNSRSSEPLRKAHTAMRIEENLPAFPPHSSTQQTKCFPGARYTKTICVLRKNNWPLLRKTFSKRYFHLLLK